ncbi:hypothetical protein [Nocardia heshunensis]
MITHLIGMIAWFVRSVPARQWLVVWVVCAVTWLCWLSRNRLRRKEAERAVWVAITPPARWPADAGERFARSLAGLCRRTHRHALWARCVACEFVATDAGTQVGLWVPPALTARTVITAVIGAWPGAQATVTAPPSLIEGTGGLAAREVLPRGGEWSPVVAPSSGWGRAGADLVDPLGQVLTVLAERGPGEVASVTIIVAAHRGTGTGRPALRALDAVLAFLQDVLREAMRGGASPSPRPAATVPVDPVAAVRYRNVVAKKASGPHLRVTVRVAVSGRVPARYLRHEARLIADGYDAVATDGDGLITRRVRRPAHKVALRRPGTGFVVTVAEFGALWHLPTGSATYGIDTNPARSRRPHRDIARNDDQEPQS